MSLQPLEFVEELFPEAGRFYAKCFGCAQWCEHGHDTKTGAERLAKALGWSAYTYGWVCPKCKPDSKESRLTLKHGDAEDDENA
jgi:hypothetical protein